MMKDNDNDRKPIWWMQPMQIFLRLSGWIAIPLIASLFFGKWLDKKFGTAPWIMLALTGLAFAISMFGIIKNTIEEFKKIEEENKKIKK